MKKILCYFVAPLMVSLLWPGLVFSYNNTSLKWETIETEHFKVHFHQGARWTAEEIARVAEEVYPPITALYRYEPDEKVHVIIKDSDDYANGAAYFYDNKMEIWATNLEFGFRGTTRWLRNVFTHEFTHIISIQAAMKFPRRIPALYFQWIDFEKEKRSDVLTGYPNHIISYPIAGELVPPWFAEGIAQFMAPSVQYDCWDTHRDMILRCGVLEDGMLTYDEMGFFGKNGMDGEKVYDHGYGLVRHIVSRYGTESISEISNALGSITRLNMDGALKEATGKTGRELYDEWRMEMRERYGNQAADIRENLKEGRVVADGGYMTIAPSFSPDGKRFVFLSNKGSDFGSTSLSIVDRNGENRKVLKPGVSSKAVFSPDGKKLVYSKKGKIDRYGSKVNDLYLYDLDTKKEKRLSRRLRASEASFSPDGKRIVCVLNGDGTHTLAVMETDGKNVRNILTGAKGTQFYAPAFSPDGERILFGIFEEGTRDIAVISREGENFAYILRTPNDERDVSWIRGGKGIIFSSDRSGVFNIYEMDLETGNVSQLTNVVGGAFIPALAPDKSALAYTLFNADGYSVALIESPLDPVTQLTGEAYTVREAPNDPCVELKGASLNMGSREKPKKAVATGLNPVNPHQEMETKPYKRNFSSFQFYPRFVMYERTPRIGLFIASYEMIDKQNFFLGASAGTNKEFDAFLTYELREWYPTLFIEFIRLREYFDDKVVIEDDPFIGSGTLYFDLQYDLWQADIGIRLEFEDIYSLTHRNVFSLFFTHGEYGVHYDGDFFNAYGDYLWHERAGWKYYRGNDITAKYYYKSIARAVDSNINPRGGREFTVQYMRAFDELFTSGEFEYGFNPVFDKNHYNKYSIDWTEYVALPYLSHSLQLRLYASAIDKRVDDFFWLYIGGRDYLRGYTYYSIGGGKALLTDVAYRFPIWRRINKQFLHIYLRDIFGSFFYQAGNAWNEDKLIRHGYKKTFGYELRVGMGSFYTYPTMVSFMAAYPLNEVVFNDPVFGELPIVKKKKWQYYLTVGFEF